VTGQRKTRAGGARGGALSWLNAFAAGIFVGLGLSVADRFIELTGAPGLGAPAATAPTKIPLAGWKSALSRSFKSFGADQIPAAAGGVTFFVLLALFPALSAFASLYGLFADLAETRRQIEGLNGLLPGGAVSVLNDAITRLANTKHGSLGFAFAVSFLISIWSSNAGVKALIAALNDAYEEKERRGFLPLNALSLGFTVGLIVFAVAAGSALVAAPATLRALGLAALAGPAVLRWPAVLIAVGTLFSLLYRFGPCRAHAKWRWITPGSALAALAWVAMSVGFSWYVANFGHYDKTYGSLGAIVGFMTWIWLSVMVVLYGAELNSALELQTSADTTTGPPKPAGLRGAAVADRAAPDSRDHVRLSEP
jgi:membrane protein